MPENTNKSAKAWAESLPRRPTLGWNNSASISFDKRLYEQDIRGSIGHAPYAWDAGPFEPEEFEATERELNVIKERIEKGDFEYSFALEDAHMHIEKALTDKLGDPDEITHGAQQERPSLHRLRLWIRDAIDNLDALSPNCRRRLSVDATEILTPSCPRTRTRSALNRFSLRTFACVCREVPTGPRTSADCRKRVNTLSLGAAACAGTSLPIDRAKTAEYLGFEAIAANSVDVSSDRDFATEFAYVMAQIAVHLSGWAEDWIWQSTVEFDFLKTPQPFCTGSSIMPQKVNPDALELIRGKTARVVGNLQTLLVLTKGLPLAYNRDLQEDKEPVFDSYDAVSASLALAAPIAAGTVLNRESIAARLEKGYLDATSLMEYLIRKGVPQRSAHGVVGRLVRQGIDSGKALAEFPLETFQEACELIDESVYDYLGTANAVKAMKSYGSTAPDQVRFQIDSWKERLGL